MLNNRWARLLCIVLLACIGAPQLAQAADSVANGASASAQIDVARLWLGETNPAQRSSDEQALDIRFTDYWTTSRRMQANQGWYEFLLHLPAQADPHTQWVVFIPNLSGRAEVYWDGEFLGRTLPLTGTGIPFVAGPLMLTIPSTLMNADQHRLWIRFEGNVSHLNFMRQPVIAAMDQVRDTLALKQMTLVYLPLTLSVVSIIVALVFFAAYRTDPTAAGIGWLTGGLVAASLSVLGLYLSAAEPWVDWLTRVRLSLFHLSFLMFLLAINQMRGVRVHAGVWAMIALNGLFVAAIFAAPAVYVYRLASLWMLASYGLGIYLFVRVVGLSMGPPRRLLSVAPLVLVPLVHVHDWVGIFNGGRFLADQMLGVYNAALFAFALMILLVLRARQHMQQTLALNQDLEQRVAEKHRQLEENYALISTAERREAVLHERERMVRDMHDGLGGQLVSTLALVESGQFSRDEVEAALRDSLDDLRMMVHSLDQDDADLANMLAILRERLEPRLARQNIRIKWQVEDLPDAADLRPEQATHVLRIVQESLTNVLKHAGASEITLAAKTAPDGTLISIEDNGCGRQAAKPAAVGGGKGLRHMAERAAMLGAQLTVSPGQHGHGTRVQLLLPNSTGTTHEQA